jgi:beta-barrel assembly-enhancing protease
VSHLDRRPSAASGFGRVPRWRSGYRRGCAAAPFLALLLLGGCISEEREQDIGDTMASEINPHLPLLEEPLLNAYLQSVGQTLAEVSERPNLDYRFYLINTDAVNAFALPGGHIYVTRGLVERTRSGAEFAGVLAHEIGHVAARHGVDKLQRQLRTGSLVNVLYDMILGGEPALLQENALQLANVVWSARHSRRDEEEADLLAMRYLVRTGAEPHAVVTLLESLLVEEQRRGAGMGALEVWFSTHPLTSDRIREAESSIEGLSGVEEQVTDLDLGAFDAFRKLVTNAPTGQSMDMEL